METGNRYIVFLIVWLTLLVSLFFGIVNKLFYYNIGTLVLQLVAYFLGIPKGLGGKRILANCWGNVTP